MDLVCFTNCFLPQDDGSLVRRDLWIDAQSGTILDAQHTFYATRQRPARIIDLDGNILSPGFLDIQINGAYGFDFSIYEDDASYEAGLERVAHRIVETGVTSLVPTIITQERSLYPKLLSLLRPHSYPPSPPSDPTKSASDGGATLLGWHAEGPFLQPAKRGAHAEPLLVSAAEGIKSFEDVYGAENIGPLPSASTTDGSRPPLHPVRVITAAPELPGLMSSIPILTSPQHSIVFSVGHSIASSPLATQAVRHGARLVTHLFNAMPQMHHRDPAIIGLLGAGGKWSGVGVGEGGRVGMKDEGVEREEMGEGLGKPAVVEDETHKTRDSAAGTAEALDELLTPPHTPPLAPTIDSVLKNSPTPASLSSSNDQTKGMPSLRPGDVYARPYYGLIVDGIHSHPNSVRLAYDAHPEGCILVTDAMSFLDPHLPDGPHAWRDGRSVFKSADKLTILHTNTLAGSVVTLDTCIRNFMRFTSASIGEALVCATRNPARCLGVEGRKGTLVSGADADLVVIGWDGVVKETWVAGRRVWKVGERRGE